ncbi:MAG: phosphate transporter, periplasmic phosphate-binding protein [Pseudonocardiales bacterium]|nr:phosphate transporter, periplasmic phosphate-binding protein [Pseudonocardiales bacterium]
MIGTRTRATAQWAVGLTAAFALAACGSSGGDSGNTGSDGSSAAAAINCATGSLKAEGSTAQTNAITEWITNYQTECSGATIAYNGTGSGAGRTNFIAGQVDFAGSDAALSESKGEFASAATRCGGNPAINLPMVVGPIAVAYNVNGLTDLILTPAVTADIFLGKITKWDDKAIAAINKDAKLPSTAIKVFFRSDDSGTTQNFTTYLNTSAPTAWTAAPAQKWAGTVGEGKKGSDGVQQGVAAADGGIGYMEYSFADNGGLNSAQIDNGGGAVELSPESASKALEGATVVGTGSDLSLKLDYATKAKGAYPIVLVTYEVVCTKGLPAAQGALVKSFLTYTAGDGQDVLGDLGYAPLPDAIATKVQAAVATLS